MPYLIDESALARTQHPAVGERLAPIIESREVTTCSIVDLEVLYPTRNEYSRVRARRALDVQVLLACRDQHRLSIPDLIIAAAAEAARMTVLHHDADFDAIAAVTGRGVDWIAPRGLL